MIHVWFRNFLFFKKTFFVSIFWTVIEPLMYLGALGYGFGRYVPPIEGLSFLDFYFPGLLCSTAMMVSYFESTYPNYTKLTYQKTFSTIMLTPLTYKDILLGEILWGATKGIIGVFGVLLISSFFGLFSWSYLLILPILFLLCLVFSAFGMIMISLAKNYDTFIFSTSGLIIPLSLISGTYFSLKDIPEFFRWLAYLFPLSHATQTVRGILYRGFDGMYLVHILVLVIYLVGLTYLADKLFKKKLIS